MKRGQRWWIVAGLLVAGSACSYRAPGEGVAFPAAEESVSLNFVNDYGMPLKVYTVESGVTQPLGTIYPGPEARLNLRSNPAGYDTVQVIIQPMDGQRRISTRALILPRGSAIDFTISRPLASSIAAIRP